jgi:putative Ca2+/H+ antiporter (TMEM165/GDT1 family)
MNPSLDPLTLFARWCLSPEAGSHSTSHTAWHWTVVVTVFSAIFVAQLPGKSALAALLLATRYRLLPVVAGAALALATHSAIAVAAGSIFSVLPARPVHLGAGIVFVASAVLIWRGSAKSDASTVHRETKASRNFMRVFYLSWVAVFVAEWGDLTQVATAALAARYSRPLAVFAAATLALWTATSIAVLVGRGVGHLLRPEVTKKIAATLFAAMGMALIAGIV